MQRAAGQEGQSGCNLAGRPAATESAQTTAAPSPAVAPTARALLRPEHSLPEALRITPINIFSTQKLLLEHAPAHPTGRHSGEVHFLDVSISIAWKNTCHQAIPMLPRIQSHTRCTVAAWLALTHLSTLWWGICPAPGLQRTAENGSCTTLQASLGQRGQ